MDMQNVSNLQIPEGTVRTIHDKDNRLIWGRVAYDTKYSGDTYQQNYSGKNKVDGRYPACLSSGRTTIANTSNGVIVTRTVETGAAYVIIPIPNIETLLDKTLSYSFNASGDYATDVITLYGFKNNKASNTRIWAKSTTSGTFVMPSSIQTGEDGYCFCLYVAAGAVGNVATFTNFILEEGSTSTGYEPYVGGIPAPNPDYPQDIQVVTGEQIISITDGTNTQNFTVNLGATELCKIGTYQDYIYKSGDDWYVHKKIREKVLDGTETWSSQTGSHTVVSNFYTPTTGWGAYAGNKPLFCSIARFSDAAGSSNDSIINICRFNNIGINFLLDVSQSEFPTVTSFQTWIENHNVTLYYVIAAPTDTQITDATLIGQLDAIHQWLTRYGYNATVSGDLPIVLQRDSLQ